MTMFMLLWHSFDGLLRRSLQHKLAAWATFKAHLVWDWVNCSTVVIAVTAEQVREVSLATCGGVSLNLL